jgi:hypothetical protein
MQKKLRKIKLKRERKKQGIEPRLHLFRAVPSTFIRAFKLGKLRRTSQAR